MKNVENRPIWLWKARLNSFIQAGLNSMNESVLEIHDEILCNLIRDCFLKTLWDTDATDFTEVRGKSITKKAPFRGFREIRVQKR